MFLNIFLSSAKRSGGYANAGHRSVRPRYVASALRFLFVDQLISNLHTSIILGISSLSLKLGKISKCYNFNENLYLEDFRPEECDLKMAAIWWPFWQLFSIWSPKHINNFEMLQLQRKLIFRGF